MLDNSAPSSSLQHTATVVGLALALLALARQGAILSSGIRRAKPANPELREPLLHQPPPPNDEADEDALEPNRDHPDRSKSHAIVGGSRLQALDAFRGLTLCLMVFVNYGGGGYAAFAHSTWDGLTVADLLFPWFAWILGFSVFLSSSAHGDSKPQSLLSIGQRAVTLFLLGIFLNNGESWSHWRIPGVLQALSAAYLVVALADRSLERCGQTRATVRWHLLLGVLPLIVGNLLLTFVLPVPGCPTGYIGPGGLAEPDAYRNCTGGAHLYVDLVVFGRRHLFQTPTCQQRYHTGPYDPEGLVNWLMVASTAYLGYLNATVFMRTRLPANLTPQEVTRQRLQELLSCGGALVLSSVAVGGLWVFPRSPWIPLNKNLWSLSYVLLSSGLATLLFGLLVKLVEDGGRVAWLGAPCISVGKNSIAIYVMHEMCQQYAPFSPKPVEANGDIPQLELLLYNLVGAAWWIVVARWMHERQIFIKV